MRAFAIALLCLIPIAAQAKPHAAPAPEFNGDRWVRVAQPAGASNDVTRAMRSVPPPRKAKAAKAKRTHPRARQPRPVPVPRPRPIEAPGDVQPMGDAAPQTLATGFAREVGRGGSQVIGSRPAGCPHRFCACALAIKIFGRIVPALNLAANWMRTFPRATPAGGMVAARHGHAFQLIAHVGGSTWRVWDANSGRGRIRIHNRSIAGYAVVDPRGRRA